MPLIDHLILNVNDIRSSVDFYVNAMGFQLDGEEGPFTVIRVNENFILLLGPWGTKGGEHLAFSMSRGEFNKTFATIKEKGIPYGDSFHSVGNNLGPGRENGARGPGPTVYINDPNKHLIEIRTYE